MRSLETAAGLVGTKGPGGLGPSHLQAALGSVGFSPEASVICFAWVLPQSAQ